MLQYADDNLSSPFENRVPDQLNSMPENALAAYSLRDEQEKYFCSMKSRIDADMQRNWSERAGRGARFIEFVALIIISYIKHVWSSSEVLRKAFPYIYSMLLTMRQIHCVEHVGRTRSITIFLKKQELICQESGIRIPPGCEAVYETLEIRPTRKPGRRPRGR